MLATLSAAPFLKPCIIFIILSGNEFCERLAYYGLATNLVVYMTRVMGQDASSAAFHVNLWGGSCYLTPLLGAYLADSKW